MIGTTSVGIVEFMPNLGCSAMSMATRVGSKFALSVAIFSVSGWDIRFFACVNSVAEWGIRK